MNRKVQKAGRKTVETWWNHGENSGVASCPIYTVLTLLNKMAGRGHVIGYAQMPSSSSYWSKMSADLIQGSMGLKKEVISGRERECYYIEQFPFDRHAMKENDITHSAGAVNLCNESKPHLQYVEKPQRMSSQRARHYFPVNFSVSQWRVRVD